MNAISPRGVVYHRELVQGTQQWLDARRGLLTASEMCRIITPAKLTPAASEKQRAHVYEIAAQRISGYVEPSYIGDDMLRGQEDEIDARDLYRQHYAPTEDVGFITNDEWGFTLGYSPDGLVGEDGVIEAKSRRQHFQIETTVKGAIPAEHVIQVQSGLLISKRKWCDFISYSAGLPMDVIQAEAVPEIQEAIVEAARAFEAQVAAAIEQYHAAVRKRGLHPTERRIEREIMI
jgi:hypothetical protein